MLNVGMSVKNLKKISELENEQLDKKLILSFLKLLHEIVTKILFQVAREFYLQAFELASTMDSSL